MVQVAAGRNSTHDLYSAGKTMFVALVAVVTAEIGLLARFWTLEFCLCAFFSYTLVRSAGLAAACRGLCADMRGLLVRNRGLGGGFDPRFLLSSLCCWLVCGPAQQHDLQP